MNISYRFRVIEFSNASYYVSEHIFAFPIVSCAFLFILKVDFEFPRSLCICTVLDIVEFLMFVFLIHPTLIRVLACTRFSSTVRLFYMLQHPFGHILATLSGPHSGPRSRAYASKSIVLCSPHYSGMSMLHGGDALLGMPEPC